MFFRCKFYFFRVHYYTYTDKMARSKFRVFNIWAEQIKRYVANEWKFMNIQISNRCSIYPRHKGGSAKEKLKQLIKTRSKTSTVENGNRNNNNDNKEQGETMHLTRAGITATVQHKPHTHKKDDRIEIEDTKKREIHHCIKEISFVYSPK